MRKKILALILSVFMCLCFAGCGNSSNNQDSNEPPKTDEEPENPNNPNEPEKPGEDNKEGTVDDLVKNFWSESVMTDETVLLVAATDANGNVLSAPQAKLMFDATEIISVKQYFHENNGGKIKEFENEQDYRYRDGVLSARGNIQDNPITGLKEFNTVMPYVTDKALTGEQPFPGLGQSTDIPSTDTGLYLPFTESYQIVQMQVSVTYKHNGGYAGAIPKYEGASLSKTVQKLKAKEKVELFVYGDSISTGANTSGYLNIEPHLPTWPQLVADNLSRYYGGEVKLTNRAVGGWTSANGLAGGIGWVGGQQINQAGLDALLKGELKDYSPDIAFIGFGMNDATMGLALNNYLVNTKEMIDLIRGRNPNCEIVLIGTMLANPKAKNQSKNQAEYSANLKKVADMYSSGVCVVDVGAVHKGVLDAGKHYTEISSNNVNHPNDFTARLYAMTLLSSLIEYGGGAVVPPAEQTQGNAVLESYKKRGYNALFADPYMKKGIAVTDADGNAQNSLVFPDSSGVPEWSFAQWFTKYDISDYYKRSYSDGGATFTYKSKGKTVNGAYVPAKVLTVNSAKATVYMELNAEAEYDEPRKDGEGWPHTLLSQDFSNNLVHVSECKELIMRMDYTITKCEDKMNGSANAGLHCAQFVWYITLQNRTAGHPDFGEYVWFGLNLWDNRNEGKPSAEWGAQDAGKDDATGKFIYHPASDKFLPNGLCPSVGQKTEVTFAVLQSARRSFELAQERGYLKNTAWEDLYVGGMNFGFENTGTYNSAVQIDTVNVYYK